jgi:cobalt/nickel transport system permease protein
MGSASVVLHLPLAVHISDGALTAPWLAGGFAIALLLAVVAAFRVRDEEVPRIALLTAAFFVASLIHVRLGPTSVHLLLNGLVGVVLGRRAPLAILVGLGLQAALLGHGGLTSLGVNACVLTLPALLAGGLFALLYRVAWLRKPGLLFLVGGIVGASAVLATLLLNALALLWGGVADWHSLVVLVFLAHLPLVAVEGVVLGFTVSFLARVKPEMLGPVQPVPLPQVGERWHPPKVVPHANGSAGHGETATSQPAPITVRPPALLLALLTTIVLAGPARAHRLEGEYQVLADGKVKIESWFDITGDSPRGATVKVFGPDGRLRCEGQLDEQGVFVFDRLRPEELRVVISAGAGHLKELTIPGESDAARPAPTIDRSPRVSWRDALVGVAFVLAAGAFVMGLRNNRRLQEIQRLLESRRET